jgi:hypothetical protein
LLIDSAFAQVRPSPWRQAVDLANMMLVLGLRTSAERVYARARLCFTDTEIAEAFAATRGLTMPSQLRRMLRAQGHDLHSQFVALLPYRLPPVRIQRWSLRRLALSVFVLVMRPSVSGRTTVGPTTWADNSCSARSRCPAPASSHVCDGACPPDGACRASRPSRDAARSRWISA